MLHCAFDADPGTLESELCKEGNTEMRKLNANCGMPIKQIGAHLIAWNKEQHQYGSHT